MKNKMPSLSPIDKNWPPRPYLFLDATHKQLERIFHLWRVNNASWGFFSETPYHVFWVFEKCYVKADFNHILPLASRSCTWGFRCFWTMHCASLLWGFLEQPGVPVAVSSPPWLERRMHGSIPHSSCFKVVQVFVLFCFVSLFHLHLKEYCLRQK